MKFPELFLSLNAENLKPAHARGSDGIAFNVAANVERTRWFLDFQFPTKEKE